MLVTRMWLLAGAIWWTPAALAQTTLGALLDGGAKPLPAAQFKEEVVQRTLVGPTSTGGSMEVIYAMSGTIQGRGTSDTHRSAVWGSAPVSGDWTPTKRAGSARPCACPAGRAGSIVVLPSRCQYWFKLDDKYFFADSDPDRSAKVLSRTIKQ